MGVSALKFWPDHAQFWIATHTLLYKQGCLIKMKEGVLQKPPQPTSLAISIKTTT